MALRPLASRTVVRGPLALLVRHLCMREAPAASPHQALNVIDEQWIGDRLPSRDYAGDVQLHIEAHPRLVGTGLTRRSACRAT